MPTYVFENKDGEQIERLYTVDECPKAITVSGVRYRKIIAPVQVLIPEHMKAGFQSSARHDRWFNSPETQKKLKEGEIQRIPKGDL